MAKLPAPSVSHYRVQDFSGGLNTNSDPSLLEDNEASDLLNVDFDSKGVVQKRPAVRVDQHLPVSGHILGLFDFYRKNDVLERIVISYDSNNMGDEFNEIHTYYKPPGEDVVRDFPIDLVEEDGTTPFLLRHYYKYSAIDLKWCFFNYNDKCYMTCGAYGLFVYEGYDSGTPLVFRKTPTGSKEDGTDIEYARPCRYAIVHKDRVFYAGFPEESDLYVWSEAFDPVRTRTELVGEGVTTQDSAGGFAYIPSNDVEITGMGTFLEKLIIFKMNSAYVLSGSGTLNYTLDKINVADGCVNHYTIFQGNNYLYFLSPTGLNYLYSPDQQMIETSSLSDKIKDELLSHDLSKSFSLAYSGKYYLFLTDMLYVYDEVIKCWTKHDVKMSGGTVDKANQKIVFFFNDVGGYSRPYLYTFSRDHLNDELVIGEETAIICRYQTRYFDFLEPELMKRMKFVKIFFSPTDHLGEIRLIQEINYRSQTRFVDTSYHSMIWGQSKWGGSSWGASVGFNSKKVPIGGQGEYVRYTFVNDKLDQEFKIFSFIIGFKRKQKVR